jgi:hypothetical protein
VAAAIFAVVVLLLHLAGGWYFASKIDERALSAAARLAALTPTYSTQVLAVGGDTVTLKNSGDARLARNGTFGLTWDGGWGTIGDVVRTESGGVVRQFHYQAGRALQSGTRVSLASRVYQGDPLVGRGITFENVTFEGELGQYSAWFVPGDKRTWFIFVHGNSMTRLDGLRILPTVTATGMPTLLPTYRGDDGAPEDPGGRLTYGVHEWRDLESAVRYALDHGADSVVLEGVSMGGAVVVSFLLESPLASHVSGVILDSPMLDFERSVEFQAGRESVPVVGLPLPGTLVATAEWLATLRFDVDWSRTNYLKRAGDLRTPILLIHGTADDTVPVETSAELARVRPDLVRDFYVVHGAGHVEAWNASPDEYQRRVLAFLEDLGAVD